MDKLIKLLPSQKKFLSHKDDTEYAFCAAIGTGKSFACALWILNRVLEYAESYIIASQTFTTTKTVQFKAVVDAMDMLGLKEGIDYTYNKSDLIMEFPNGAMLRGGSSQAPNAVTGATKYNGAWFDEAAIFSNEARQYIMGRCRGIDSKGRLIEPKYRYTGSPPLEGHTGWYKDFLQNHPDKAVFASMEEAVGKTLSEVYFHNQIEIYGGVDNPVCRAQVFGEIIDDNIGCYVFNNKCFGHEERPRSGMVSMGVDCSGAGRDFNEFWVIDDVGVIHREKICQADTFKMNSIARSLIDRFYIKQVTIDCTGGFGNGLHDMLSIDRSLDVMGVNFGQSASKEGKEGERGCDKYANARAEMYFKFAKACREGFFVSDSDVIRQLKAQSYFINKSGKTQLLDKEEIRKILGCSPDASDALVLAYYRRDNLRNLHPEVNSLYKTGFKVYD